MLTANKFEMQFLKSIIEVVKNLRDFGIYLTKDVEDLYGENY